MARDTSEQAVEEVERITDHVSESLRKGYEQAETLVQQRPAESVALAFGLGIVVGAVVGLVLRNR